MAQPTATEIMMQTLAGSFALQGALYSVRNFDGHNMPLKDFIQDLRNGKLHIVDGKEKQYVAAVLGRLEGSARDCTYGKEFLTVESLIKHLKTRFAPGKNYSYYTNKINNLRMKQGDTVGDFYDKLNILISGARSALKEELELNEETVKLMIKPLCKTSLDIFIRGLPADIARQVDSIQPNTLEAAYDEAIRIETRMEAKIIPDTRNNFYSKKNHNWEQDEYSSSNHRNHSYEDHNPRNFTAVHQPSYVQRNYKVHQPNVEQTNYNYQQNYRQTRMPQVNRQEYTQHNVNYIQPQQDGYQQNEPLNRENGDNFSRNIQQQPRLFDHKNGRFTNYQPQQQTVRYNQGYYNNQPRYQKPNQYQQRSYNQYQQHSQSPQYSQNQQTEFQPREIMMRNNSQHDNQQDLNLHGAQKMEGPMKMPSTTSTSMQAHASTSGASQNTKPVMIIQQKFTTLPQAKLPLAKEMKAMSIH